MFSKNYRISIINSKWHLLKNDLKLKLIPRKGEFIYMDEQYFEVLNVVHRMNKIHEIFIVVLETQEKDKLENTLNQLVNKKKLNYLKIIEKKLDTGYI